MIAPEVDYICVGTFFKFIASISTSVNLIIASVPKSGTFLFILLEASKNVYGML
jgi:hypothetical protein